MAIPCEMNDVIANGMRHFSAQMELPNMRAIATSRAVYELMDFTRNTLQEAGLRRHIRELDENHTSPVVSPAALIERGIIQGMKGEKRVKVQKSTAMSMHKQSRYSKLVEGGTLGFNAGWQGVGLNIVVPASVFLQDGIISLDEQTQHMKNNEYLMIVDRSRQDMEEGTERERLEKLTQNNIITNEPHKIIVATIIGECGETVLREFGWEKKTLTDEQTDNELAVLKQYSRTNDVPAGLLFPRPDEDYIIIASTYNVPGKISNSNKRENLPVRHQTCCQRFISCCCIAQCSEPVNDNVMLENNNRQKVMVIASSLNVDDIKMWQTNPLNTDGNTKGEGWIAPMFGSMTALQQIPGHDNDACSHVITTVPMVVGMLAHEHFDYKEFDANIVLTQHTKIDNKLPAIAKERRFATVKIQNKRLERRCSPQAVTIVRFDNKNNMNNTKYAWG